MSNLALDEVSIDPASGCTQRARDSGLAIHIEELAGLRFSILLTEKWEESGEENSDQRAELRKELMQLRTLYFDKIDRIAMTFGVVSAMKAKEEIERSVALPHSTKFSIATSESEQLHF